MKFVNLDSKLKIVFLLMVVSLMILVVAMISIGLPINATFEAAKTMPQVGFIVGFIHGILIVISFVISLFNDNYTIYAIYNNGIMYNFGFIFGILSLISSGRS